MNKIVKPPRFRLYALRALCVSATMLWPGFHPWVSSSWAQGDAISLEDVDTDKDGHVSPAESRAYILRLERAHEFERQKALNAARQEAQAAAQKVVSFDPADLDRDGIVTDEEHAAHAAAKAAPAAVPAAVPAPQRPAPQETKPPVEDVTPQEQKKLDKRTREMKKLDINNDGILQASELQQAAGQKFDAADTNKDGILSPAEVEASMAQFDQQQADAYGKAVGKQETARLRNRLKNADADSDGQVSKEEYETFMNERQSLFDRDGDGVISAEEYRTDGEKMPSSYRKKTRD